MKNKVVFNDLTVKTGPEILFDMDEIKNPNTLEFHINTDEVIVSKARPGKEVRKVVVDFKSQDWHGFEWKHTARLFVPSDCPDKSKAGIIGAKWQDFEEGSDRSIIPESGKGSFAEYAEGTALDLGMPIMAFSVPGEDINGMYESDLAGWALEQMLETGDYTWYSYYPITKAYLRAITLMQEILEVRKIRTVLLGCSKRGASICIATGVDPERVAGVMATCYPGGNFLYLAALKFAHFGPGIGGSSEEHTGPGYMPGLELLKLLNNPIGLTSLGIFDPYLWRDQIKSKYLVALGTNDEFFGLGAEHGMLDDFNGDSAFLAIDNIDHSWVSEKHLAAWRMWLAYSFDRRSIPKIVAKSEQKDSRLWVEASIETDLRLKEVTLYYAYNETSDWRFALWLSEPMSLKNSKYGASVPMEEKKALAYYVEVKDVTGGLISSMIQFA